MNPPNAHERRLALICQRCATYPPLAASVVRTAKLIARRIHDRANATLAPWGLTHPEFNVLAMLYGTEDFTLNPSQLADAVGEKSANLTRLTNQLCEKGLIERTASAQDRRKVAVALSTRGRQLLEEALPAVSADLQAQANGMAPEELAQLARLQKAFLAQLDRHPSAADGRPDGDAGSAGGT